MTTTHRFFPTATTALFAAALVVTGCGTTLASQIPAGAHVDRMQANRLVLRGTAQSSDSPSCASAALPAAHLVEINSDMVGKIELRAAARSAAVLHVANLETNKTWCMQTRADGTMPHIPGEFAGGTYAISVTAMGAQPYEVVIERL